MKILYIAEIVGNAGVWCIRHGLSLLKERFNPDVIIANGDGATGGSGIGKKHVAYLHKLGIDVMTSGDCVFYKKDLADDFANENRIIRAVNLPESAPGKGVRICTVRRTGEKLAVVSVLGQSGSFRLHADNPFYNVPPVVERIRQTTDAVFVDFHAATTAEKKSFGYAMDGLVSVVAGSHGRVQTADATVFPRGTAYITDAGRTGSINSVGGTDASLRIKEYLTAIPDWTHDAWDLLEIQGFVTEIANGGMATSIEPFRFPVPGTPQSKGDSE